MAVSDNALIDAGVRVGLISAETVDGLRLQARRERLGLLEVVTRAGRFPVASLYQALADVRGIPFMPPSELTVDPEALTQLPRQMLYKRLMLPVRRADGTRLLALGDPDDRVSLERVERVTGLAYQPALAEPEVLRSAIARSFFAVEAPGTAEDAAETGDPVQMLDNIMKAVYLHRASDVHFEPRKGGMRIRLRVDGRMQIYRQATNAADEEGLINRIKVLAGLDIAEQRRAQDGALKYAMMNWDLPETDIRVATIPTRWGERCTMRILGEDTGRLSLEELGMPAEILQGFRRAIDRPHGMILVTGPTGSGKSTTLYAAIRELRLDDLNVLTVEDPVEQTIEGISQVQVSSKVGFAQALRSFLRHDPDVILVGEIRDRETVDIGLRAAMTGHLVLSTLHTNDSVGAITRLADIGAERYLIGATLIGVLAQRLTRRLCPHCKRPRPARAEERRMLGRPEGGTLDLWDPVGCSFCQGTGFRGRIGLFEALWIDHELRLSIAEGAGERRLYEAARGRHTLWQDCCHKVVAGEVALAEVRHFHLEVA